jgi:3-isopropylmalate/(R)-2-methylmalate dehydratase small subunit
VNAAVRSIEGLVAPLLADNVDTDAIIPAAYMRSVGGDQGAGLFARWRLLAGGAPNPDFVLNEPRYRGAGILMSGTNFGCGSSRENAVWALQGFGFRCVIARSFSDIFYDNALRSGLVAVRLRADEHQILARAATQDDAIRIVVDLGLGAVMLPTGERLRFDIEERRRAMLMNGWDEISLTEQRRSSIAAFRASHRARCPWLYLDRGEGQVPPTGMM